MAASLASTGLSENVSPTASSAPSDSSPGPSPGPVLLTGTPLCVRLVLHPGAAPGRCSNRSMPGSDPPLCRPHGGQLRLREDGTLGVIGPGAINTIAQMTGLDPSWVRQVLGGRGNPSLGLLERIGNVVGLSVGEVIEYIERNRRQ